MSSKKNQGSKMPVETGIELTGKNNNEEIDPAINAAKAPKIPLKCWVVLLISCVGALMASVSTSALVIAFPTLMVDLNMSISTMMWILLVVLLLIGGTVGIAGKLGDIFGQATLYKIGYAVFVAGSFIAGFSQKKNQGMDLLGARVIIGFGAAFLFTNSNAIVTTAFAPYGKVGLAQGIFQLSLAIGMVLGPLVGGALEKNWRWIFFWNVPCGGLCVLLAIWAVEEYKEIRRDDVAALLKKFDWIGAIFYPMGLTLILTAMIQVVSPEHNLSRTSHVAWIITGGIVSGAIFVIDQFFAVDPLVPPEIFLGNKVFTITTITGTLMSFVRNSITYNMIFYLQGPMGMTPLDAGIALIPFGIGVLSAGFAAGALADKVGVRAMTVVGPLITLLACGIFLSFDQFTRPSEAQGVLYLAGFGLGCFGSPNSMANMLSIPKEERGVAAGVGMITMMFMGMLAIVLTFHFVITSMTQAELFTLFLFGGSALSSDTIKKFMTALNTDYYIVIAACLGTAVFAFFNDFKLPNKRDDPLAEKHESHDHEVMDHAAVDSDHKVIESHSSLKSASGSGKYKKIATNDEATANNKKFVIANEIENQV